MSKYAVGSYKPAPPDNLTPERIREANADGINNPNMHLWYYTPVLAAAMALGQRGIDLSDSPIVEGIRYGAAPESGLSHNYADDRCEFGLSLAQLANGAEIGSAIWFADRAAYEYRGLLVGTGSDGEAIILPLHVVDMD